MAHSKKGSEAGHKRFGPSKSARWLNCAGSVKLSESVPKPPTSKYAAEGTAAHKVAELCLKEKRKPISFLGKKVEGVIVDEEMVEGVEFYVDVIWEDIAKIKDKDFKTYVEYRSEDSEVHPDFGGTSDFILERPSLLTAYDLKYGKGHDVDAEDNTQGLSYLLDKAMRDGFRYKKYEIVIVQPRLENEERRVKRWTLTQAKLKAFLQRVLAAIQEAEGDDPPFQSGDWCVYCPGAAICPSRYNTQLEVAQIEFEPMEALDLRRPIDLTPKQLRFVLDNAKGLRDWLNSVEAHAKHMIEIGEEVEGFKLVRGRANRAWKEGAEEKLLSRGYDKGDLYEVKLASPAKLEKIYEPEGFSDLWEKPEGSLSLVPVSDARQALPSSASSDFEE